MRRSLFMLCAMGGCLIPCASSAQFDGGRGADRGLSPSPPKASAIRDDDLRPIQLEIAILDAPAADAGQPALKDEQQISRLERLESEGKLTGLQRMKVSLIANQQSQFQMGETAQITVGRTMSPGPRDSGGRGGFGPSFSDVTRAQQIGTMLMATARPVENGALVEVKLERSGLTTPKPSENPDTPAEQPRTHQLTVNTTVLLPEGETKVVSSSLRSRSDGTREETWVLARAVVGPMNKPAGVAVIKIFQLKNTSAKDAADVISAVFDHGGVRAIADARTNTAIVVSAAENEMQQIEAILQKLDENGAIQPAQRLLNKLEPIPESAPLFNPDLTPPNERKPFVAPGFEPLIPRPSSDRHDQGNPNSPRQAR